jgi:hypothetical protein
MRIERKVTIKRPIGEVFAFVSDARNDPEWCEKVRSVKQNKGRGPGPGARYVVIHRPIPMAPERRMDYTCRAWDPPHRIEWHERDGSDEIEVVYELEDVGGATRLTQRDEVHRIGVPTLLKPIMKRGIGRDISHQLKTLKALLESG